MKKTVITYGLISGAISAALMLGMGLLYKNMGKGPGNAYFENGMIIGYSSMVLSFILIYFGMASYRDNVGGGQIKYGKALSIGLLITLISSACYVIGWLIVYHTMIPNFMDQYCAYVIEKFKEKGPSAAELSKKIAEMDQAKAMYKNPVVVILYTFMEPLPVGILVSLISAFIVRMKKKPAIA